jgi:hypothetical protein
MADLSDALRELRYVGIDQLPDAGDAGDRRLGSALEREMARTQSRRRGWGKRRIKIGGFALPPFAMLAVVATAAAATTAAIVTLTATNVFQNDPQGLRFNGEIETVLPATVRQLATVSIPDYGQVAVWGASTKPGGFCFALKLPNGAWGGLHTSQDARDGWSGGSTPGCFQTQQQQILLQTPLKPGQQPSAATGQELTPTPLEAWENEVVNRDGHHYVLYIGYVEAQGTATTVRDPRTGATTHVLPDGSYVISEPSPRGCGGCGGSDLQVLNAAGQPLKPDYTWGGMLPGSSVGPSHSQS